MLQVLRPVLGVLEEPRRALRKTGFAYKIGAFSNLQIRAVTIRRDSRAIRYRIEYHTWVFYNWRIVESRSRLNSIENK